MKIVVRFLVQVCKIGKIVRVKPCISMGLISGITLLSMKPYDLCVIKMYAIYNINCCVHLLNVDATKII